VTLVPAVDCVEILGQIDRGLSLVKDLLLKDTVPDVEDAVGIALKVWIMCHHEERRLALSIDIQQNVHDLNAESQVLR